MGGAYNGRIGHFYYVGRMRRNVRDAVVAGLRAGLSRCEKMVVRGRHQPASQQRRRQMLVAEAAVELVTFNRW